MTKCKSVEKKLNPFAFVDNLRRSGPSRDAVLKQHYQQYLQEQHDFLVIAAFNHLQKWVVERAKRILEKLAAFLSCQLKNVLAMSRLLVQYNSEYWRNICRFDILLWVIALASEHISNLMVINDLQMQINACYERFYKLEKKLKDLL